MIANSYKYNWIHPGWAKPDGSNPEAWHMEHKSKNSLITAKKQAGGRPRPASATASAGASSGSDQYAMGTTRTDTDGPPPAGGGEWVEGRNMVWVNKAKGQWKEIPVT